MLFFYRNGRQPDLEPFDFRNGNAENKKADMEEHRTKVFLRVGLLINGPPGSAETPFA